MKYSFPSNYGEHTYLVPIDAALVPIIAGTMRKFFDRGVWESGDDYEAGYNAFAQLLANMATVTLSDLVESNRQIYRLLDAALNGTAYSASTDQAGATTVTPAIPAAPAAVEELPGLRRQLRDAQGEIPGGWFGIGARPVTLYDVYKEMRVGSSEERQSILDTVNTILDPTSDVANIASVVSGFLGDRISNVAEGGQLVTSVVSSLAVLTTNALMIKQLTRIITAIDGGLPDSVNPFNDNILQALRGNTPASGSRNVIDSANSQALAELLDQVEPLLAEIRDKVQ